MTSTSASSEQQTDELIPDMSLKDLTSGHNGRGLPIVKFVEDIGAFSSSFQPAASAELLIGAFTELHTKYKTSEASLQTKQDHLKQKVPELDKSLSLVRSLVEKQKAGHTDGIVRYNLADNVYATAHVDYTVGAVNLWLGANVMLEFTATEATEFLETNWRRAVQELERVTTDLVFVRDQIVTSEVNMSRIYNWDVRRKRTTK